MDIVERLAQQAAETINGGEFYDGKWYTEGQRQAWRKAMTPAADEIERLRAALQKIADVEDEHINPPTTPTEAGLWGIIDGCVRIAEQTLGEKE
jgi:hypothetical protein